MYMYVIFVLCIIWGFSYTLAVLSLCPFQSTHTIILSYMYATVPIIIVSALIVVHSSTHAMEHSRFNLHAYFCRIQHMQPFTKWKQLYKYSRASEQRTLWERASCPLLGGCPYLRGSWFSTHFDCIILNKLINALKCIIRAVEMIIKWLVCSVFSINIAQAEFLFLKYWLFQNRYLDSRLILLSRMQHNIATA